MEPHADDAHRTPKDDRHLGRRQLVPGVQHQQLAIGCTERGECSGYAAFEIADSAGWTGLGMQAKCCLERASEL
jgi:hypothetical protein